ncbi:hypothetical protein AA101099_1792 [Neoasaia chiangmaiensis NBRC 101099]|uniref:Uncharacterized protein n=1 Tax=Neoasaia chiangmaiensis TaxID=320497 RepID=A0A1U9KQW3_9PROT|nr:hypothetical protein [Neoasaia chiangmaiensis]AQS88251.1 hypothetical protein A0U93_10220 [Neoasaia chiangmaiensis]GBR39729.1 hypothetical protein AA101099_1792 [Neoasaia chiangmaiensis NBRC 101099]GEN14714.1 hypothetical protein NCH01_11450 [Neoasaia chiangmaiensis]
MASSASAAKIDAEEQCAPFEGASEKTLIFVDLTRKDGQDARIVARRGAGLYGLLKNQTITEAHVAAAECWAKDYETGVMGASDPDRARHSKRGDIHDMMIARSAAMGRCQAVKKNLGALAEQYLIWLTIDGLSMSALAAKAGKDRKLVTGAVEFLLEQLVEFFDGQPGTFWRA